MRIGELAMLKYMTGARQIYKQTTRTHAEEEEEVTYARKRRQRFGYKESILKALIQTERYELHEKQKYHRRENDSRL